jgi:hypothetical protein
MEYVLLIWLAEVSENVTFAAAMLFGVYGGVVLLATAGASINGDLELLEKMPKSLHYLMAGLLVIATVLPGKQTVYVMAGAMAAQDLATGNIGQKTLLLLESKLDEVLQEGKE